MKYNVFNEAGRFMRTVEAFSSFDARKVVATFNGASVTDFYAIRDDLMTNKISIDLGIGPVCRAKWGLG